MGTVFGLPPLGRFVLQIKMAYLELYILFLNLGLSRADTQA